jgi:hypothetical protein
MDTAPKLRRAERASPVRRATTGCGRTIRRDDRGRRPHVILTVFDAALRIDRMQAAAGRSA